MPGCWTGSRGSTSRSAGPVVEPLGRAAVSVEGVVERLGGDPAAIAERPVGADFEEEGSPVVHLSRVGSAPMMVEVNGYRGATRPILERLSLGAGVHSAYWNVNALSA